MRKSQVTIFIIIGLVLIVSASLVVYLTSIREAEVAREVIVPPEIQPVYDYIAACMRESGDDALELVGMQGGYADLSKSRIETRDITLTPGAYIKIDPSNTFKLPMWFYDGESRIPPIEFIESEIASHVQKSLGRCLLGFEDLSPKYEIEELAEPVVTASATYDDVSIKLEYPLNIKESGRATEHSEFIVSIPVRLRQIWILASEIMKKENELNFFEELTIDLMSMDNKIPMDSLEPSCRPKIWTLDSVKQELQELLRYYLPNVRVKGTDYAEFEDSEKVYKSLAEYTLEDINNGDFPDDEAPPDAFMYNRMMLDPMVADADELIVSFSHQPQWGMSLNAKPNEGGVLKSKQTPGQAFLRFFCINTYHFAYDVIYPVQARVSDPEAYNGEGYVFQFGFPVLIDDNKPRREEFSQRLFEGYEHDDGFCENLAGQEYEIKVIGIDDAGFTADSGLRDVNISYHCFKKRCSLGTTGYRSDAPGRYSLITALPEGCKNPIITASKEGYLEVSGQLTGDSLVIDMPKTRMMKLDFAKHAYTSTQYSNVPVLSDSELEKQNGDKITVYAKLRDFSNSNEQYLVYEYEQEEPVYIELVDGDAKYDFDIMLFSHERLVGGYKAKNITITYNDLAGYDEAVFNVFEYRPRPVSDEAMLSMMLYYNSGEYAEQLKPEFR